MRILHLTTFLQGGAGLAITNLARLQRAAGHEVAVVTSKTAPEGYGNYHTYVETLERAGVPVHAVDSLFYRDRSSNLEVLRFLRALQAARHFDIIHTHAAVPSRIVLRLAGRHGPFVIQTMHGWGVRKTAAQQRADVAALSRVPRVVVPSRASFDLLAGLGVGRGRLRIVPYGVDSVNDPLAGLDSPDPDLDFIRHARQLGHRVACCVGTVGERKNQRLLVEALALMEKSSRPLCVFVGEGDTAGVTDLAARLHVEGHVRCTGYKANARELLQAADCLVLPSRSEGLPLAMLEAFCDRVPVIASDIAELSELIRDGENGLLFAKGDARALAVAFHRLFGLSDEERRALCRRAHERQVGHFRTSQMLELYMNEYAGLRTAAAKRVGSRCAA